MSILKALVFSTLSVLAASVIDSSGPRMDILEKALNGIASIEKNITDSISSFHFYEYDGHPYDIHDGGHGMYDSIGNKVYHSNEEVTDVLYDYNIGYKNYLYGVRSEHPLFGLMWIKNNNKEFHTYRIQIEGYPGYGASRGVNSSEGEVTLEGAKLQYKAYQVYSYGLPSICELYFVLENTLWNSHRPREFSVMTFSRTANYLQNAVYISGRPQNVILGYMLLSNSEGGPIPPKEMEDALKITANSMLHIDSNLRNFTESALLAVEAQAPAIRASVSNWYNYSYSMQEIANGGEDMFGRKGNRILFSQDSDNPIQLYYDLSYSGPNYQVISRPIHPFVGLMWITNPSQEFHTFHWKVTAFAGRNRIGLITSYEGDMQVENIQIRYNVFSLSNIRDHPSICEVYFTVESKMWDSSIDHKFTAQFGNDTENLENTVSVSGTPHHVMLGYFLLSKKNAARVSVKEVRDSLTIVAGELKSITKVSENHINEVLQAIERVSSDITGGALSNWHNYLYDEQFYKTSYEKRKMYLPWGNMMVLAEDLDHGTYNRSSYDLYYRYKKSAVKCKMNHPFVALMLIDGYKFDYYSFKIHSHADVSEDPLYSNYNGSLSVMGTRVEYFVFQLYGRTKPSICEVYFTLTNPTNWSSIAVDAYIGNHFEEDNIQDNYIYLLGYVRRVFMGYTLLSKYPGNESISEDEIRNVLTLMAQAITTSIPDKNEFAYCREETLQHPQGIGSMIFPETFHDSTAYTVQHCALNTTNSGIPFGSRKCSSEAVWEGPEYISSCDTTTTMATESTTSAVAISNTNFCLLCLSVALSIFRLNLH